MTALITSEAVNAIFANLKECLPLHVNAGPSIKFGIIVTLAITLVGIIIGGVDFYLSRKKDDAFSKIRGVIVALFVIALGIYIGDAAKDRHFTMRGIKLNRQHYTNIHWIKLYLSALRKPFLAAV